MSTIAERLVAHIVERLVDLPEVKSDEHVRRDHLTPATKEECPIIDVQMGDDVPDGKSSSVCEQKRKLAVNISIQVRADSANTEADPIVAAVYAAMSPIINKYPFGAVISDRGIRREKPEIADMDAHEIVCGFDFMYVCAAWDLSTPAGV